MAITTIAPAILSNSPTEYKQTVKDYFAFTKRAHVDISDGTLTPYRTISESAVWWPRGWQVDIHMITAKPSEHVDTLVKLHPNLVIFHAEASEDLLPIFATLKQNGIKTGIAIVQKLYPGAIKTILTATDHALIFSGNLGQQGGTANLLLLEKVSLVKEINPNIEVGWDGGASVENVRTITHAGVDVINVGSAIANATDRQAMFEQLNQETENEAII